MIAPLIYLVKCRAESDLFTPGTAKEKFTIKALDIPYKVG
jgi:hypothetical protein